MVMIMNYDVSVYWFKQGVLLPLITLLGLVGNCLSIMVLHSPGVDMKVLNKDGGVYVDRWWWPSIPFCGAHSWYLSPPPRRHRRSFIQPGALFYTENAKFGPILVYLGVFLQVGCVPKLTIMRCGGAAQSDLPKKLGFCPKQLDQPHPAVVARTTKPTKNVYFVQYS